MGSRVIDSHSHTFYSKHATGTVDELVCASIEAGVSVLTITDHAPFFVDTNNRLLESELEYYFADIDRAKHNYKDSIKILSGLELDYMPGCEDYNHKLVSQYPVDFAIGSIHFVKLPDGEMVKVWELPRLNDQDFLDQYFMNLEALIKCQIFDAVGHADTLLRGVPNSVILRSFEPLLKLVARSGIAFELNASGLRKSSLHHVTGEEVYGQWSYPSRELLRQLISYDIPFTVGSDAHKPTDAGAGIAELMQTLLPSGVRCISYYEERQRFDVDINLLMAPLTLSDGPYNFEY